MLIKYSAAALAKVPDVRQQSFAAFPMLGANIPKRRLLSPEIIAQIGLFPELVVSFIMHAVSWYELYDGKTYDVFSRPKSHVSLWTLFVGFICNCQQR